MEGIINIISLCGLIGTMVLALILIVSGIIQWLQAAEPDKRRKRLYIIAWVAFIVLCIMFLVSFQVVKLHESEKSSLSTGTDQSQGSEGRTTMTDSAELSVGDEAGSPFGIAGLRQNDSNSIAIMFLNILRHTFGFLMFGSIVFSGIMLLLIAMYFIWNGASTIFRNQNINDPADKEKSVNLKNAMYFPIVRVFISWGVIALFLILPYVAGEPIGENPIIAWQSGVDNIVVLFDMDITDGQSLPTYMLIYIIVLGVGFTVIKIICAIIKHLILKQDNNGLIDEYASPIALLAVGVALLWTFKDGIYKSENHRDIIIDLLKSFGSVMIIVALFILALEVIRLLLDMKEKLIRQEAKYMFISLTGQCALLLLGILNSILGAVNSVIGSTKDAAMDNVEEKLREKMVKILEAHINNEVEQNKQKNEQNAQKEQQDKGSDLKNTFIAFNERITMK